MAANYYKYNSATMGDRTYFTSVITDSAGNAKRYFSNVESEIYFGDYQMDDIYQFEFGIDEKILPVFGYNCYYATELVSGQRIVQGQFVVNYTDCKLIQSVLSSIDDSIYNTVLEEEYLPGGDLHHPIYGKSFDIMIGYGYYDVKDLQTYNATSQSIIGAKITGMHKVMDTTGQPLLEVFSFTAKDFIEENIIESDTGKDKDDKDEDKKAEDNIKYEYLTSDVYNSHNVEKNDKLAKKNNCPNILHQISYHEGKITVIIRVEGSTVSVNCTPAGIGLNDKYEDMVIPEFYFASAAKATLRSTIEEQYQSIFAQAKKDGKKSISCYLYYNIEITTEGKTETHQVIYPDANIYV